MNIPLFIKSLSELERKELRNYFLINPEIITTKDFLKKYEMTDKLRNILDRHSGDTDVFRYVSQINKLTFLRLRNAGPVAWTELEELLKKNKI